MERQVWTPEQIKAVAKARCASPRGVTAQRKYLRHWLEVSSTGAVWLQIEYRTPDGSRGQEGLQFNILRQLTSYLSVKGVHS